MAATIDLSPVHYQQVQGHCNVWDETINQNTFACGTKRWTVTNQNSLQNALDLLPWAFCHAVSSTASENGFLSTGLISTITHLAKRDFVLQPRSHGHNASKYTHNRMISTFCMFNFLDFNTSTVQSATRSCRKRFNIPKNAHDAFNSDPYLQSCALDYIATNGSHAFTQDHLQAYLQSSNMKFNHTLSFGKNNTKKHLLSKGAGFLGLGEHNCPSNCAGHGKCRRHGCHCQSGFGGVDCSITLTI